ncbi:hypothetical protein AKO1_015060, partial [Acrasis kona]
MSKKQDSVLELGVVGHPANKPTAPPTRRAGGSGTDVTQHQYRQPHDVTSRQTTTPTSPVDRVGGSSMSTDQILTRSHLTGSTKEPTKEEIWNALRREEGRRIEAEKGRTEAEKGRI